MSIRYALIRAAYDALALAGVPRLVRGRSSCRGVIFTLHRVLPDPPAAFSPNAILQVRPDFLDYAINRVRALGFDTVSLDEAIRRLDIAETPKPFVGFTFDDAYRDNLEHALPILHRHACTFTLYVQTKKEEKKGEI